MHKSSTNWPLRIMIAFQKHPVFTEMQKLAGPAEERYQDAVESYSKAISLVEEEQPSDWRNYYVRGISYERLDQWENAEADFRKALELQPGQALVLNYLGYSLVEKNMKIDEAREMIEEAVAGDPDNGYITDSLGWVLYKIGAYEEAVPHMERAVELLPSDPVINDHLGDVLWKVGRRNEAVFQWKRALSLVWWFSLKLGIG